MDHELDLSIIIVNWNSAAFVRKCLRSIFENTKTIRFEVIVVDNASYDGCAEMIAKEFPGVRFIQGSENSGFARANNLGFQSSRGHNLLFLNPDTEIIGSAIEKLVQFVDATPHAGVVGAKLLNSDGSIQTSCIQRYPTIMNQLLDNDLLRNRFPNWSLWGTRPLFESGSAAFQVEAISGACQMVRRTTFHQIGMYDPGYFMYAEDVDLCFTAQQKGYKNFSLADSVVTHHGGSSSSAAVQNNFSTVMTRDSLVRFFRNHRGESYATAYRSVMSMMACLRLLLMALLIIVPIGQFRRDNLLKAMKKWLKVFCWSVGLESWVQRFSADVRP